MANVNRSEVNLIYRLADLGASMKFIAQYTGISYYSIRTQLREEPQPRSENRRNWVAWFAKEPERSIHAHAIVKAYRRTPEEGMVVTRLIEAYDIYVELTPPMLTFVEAAKALECMRDGFAVERVCPTCNRAHLTFDHGVQCVICVQLAAMFCRKCSSLLPEPDASRSGKRPSLCADCIPASKRRRRRGDSQTEIALPAPAQYLERNGVKRAAG